MSSPLRCACFCLLTIFFFFFINVCFMHNGNIPLHMLVSKNTIPKCLLFLNCSVEKIASKRKLCFMIFPVIACNWTELFSRNRDNLSKDFMCICNKLVKVIYRFSQLLSCFVLYLLLAKTENKYLICRCFFTHWNQEWVSRRCLWHNLTYVQTLS